MAGEENGKLLLPRAISLGNLLSMLTTVVTVAAASYAGYMIFSYRVGALELTAVTLKAESATKEELRIDETANQLSRTELHDSIKDLAQKVDSVIQTQAANGGELKGLTATVGDLKDGVNDVKRQISRDEVRPAAPPAR